MVAESGWKEFNFKNVHGEPCFLRIHAGRMLGEGWREEDCPELRLTIRNNRIIEDLFFTDEELVTIGRLWLQETGNALIRPLYLQVLDLAKRCYETEPNCVR